MNKKNMMIALHGRHRRMLPTQRLRVRKEGEQHGGGGTAAGGESGSGSGFTPPAGGGNGGESGQSGQQANNTGDQFDPAAFWNSPAPAGQGASQGESAANNQGESGTQAPTNLGQQLTTQLASMKFGDPIFNEEIAQQINNGDFSGVQQRIEASMQNSVKQALGMMIQIMRPFGDQLQSQMRTEFGGTLEGRDNNEALVRDFPSAKDPRVAPVVKQVFEQALKNTGNKRELAVKQTKEMLALMSNVTSGDLGLNLVPQGQEYSPQQPSTNWLDELTIR